jgi:hypothetical protein
MRGDGANQNFASRLYASLEWWRMRSKRHALASVSFVRTPVRPMPHPCVQNLQTLPFSYHRRSCGVAPGLVQSQHLYGMGKRHILETLGFERAMCPRNASLECWRMKNREHAAEAVSRVTLVLV